MASSVNPAVRSKGRAKSAAARPSRCGCTAGPDAARPVPAAPAAVAEAEQDPLRILLAEDNGQVAEVAGAILTDRGHAVVTAENADGAPRGLEETSFDLVLTDIVMPGSRNGLALARLVTARWPRLPVVLMSGYSEEAAQLRAQGFTLVQKPFAPAALIAAIEAARHLAAPAAAANVVSFRGRAD